MEMTTLRSERLKNWSVGVGPRERERIRALGAVATNEPSQPRAHVDEIAAERGVRLLDERGGEHDTCLYNTRMVEGPSQIRLAQDYL